MIMEWAAHASVKATSMQKSVQRFKYKRSHPG